MAPYDTRRGKARTQNKPYELHRWVTPYIRWSGKEKLFEAYLPYHRQNKLIGKYSSQEEAQKAIESAAEVAYGGHAKDIIKSNKPKD